MSIHDVSINDYELTFGGTQEYSRRYTPILKEIIRQGLKDISMQAVNVKMYYMAAPTHEYTNIGNSEKFVIFANSTSVNANEGAIHNKITIDGIEFDYVLPHTPDGIHITSKDGVVIAEYIEENVLNILIDLFSDYSNARINMFENIIKETARKIIEKRIQRNSWRFAENQDNLAKVFQNAIKKHHENSITNIKNDIGAIKETIQHHKQQIKSLSDTLIIKTNNLETNKKSINSLSEQARNDFDNILKLDKVEDLIIENETITILTKPLYTYDVHNNKYYTGKFKIVVTPNIADVKFFGDTPRRGYWTNKDPHPHVNGSNGKACLGNVESTVAELCSQMQLYALTTILIDFLESVNVADPAGAKVRNWDMIDEEGNIIEQPKFYCETCDYEYNEGETDRHFVFINVEEDFDYDESEEEHWILGDEIEVCDECYENAYYIEACDCYALD